MKAGRRRSQRPSALLVSLLGGLLALIGGCQNLQQQAERERQTRLAREADQRRQLDALVQRCQANRNALRVLADQLKGAEGALSRLEQRSYLPTRRPLPPDPAELERYTISDQELEMERYQQAVQSWEASESARRRRWSAELAGQRAEASRRLADAREGLARLNPAVIRGNAIQPSVLATHLSCDRQALARLPLSPGDSAAIGATAPQP